MGVGVQSIKLITPPFYGVNIYAQLTCDMAAEMAEFLEAKGAKILIVKT